MVSFSRLGGWYAVLAVGAIAANCGCEHTTTNADSAPTGRSSSPSTPDVIVTITPRGADEIRKQIGDHGKFLFITAKAEVNCVGYSYEVEVRKSPPAGDVIVAPSQGIDIALNRDTADFFRGSTFDYLPDPGGLKLTVPPENVALLPENRKKREEEARTRPIEEAKSKRIDPVQAVADLLGRLPQPAFEDLQLSWKFNQPEIYRFDGATVGHVDHYKLASGEWITVVFTGELGTQRGGICLIKADGRQIPIFHLENDIDGNSQFIDVNGDGVPEIVSEVLMGGADEEDPKKIGTDATGLNIIPISPQQVPLLRIVFDVRINSKPKWRWKLAASPAGTKDIVIEQDVENRWKDRARFVWSKEESKYKGPAGSKAEGFIANAGDIDVNRIKQFMKK